MPALGASLYNKALIEFNPGQIQQTKHFKFCGGTYTCEGKYEPHVGHTLLASCNGLAFLGWSFGLNI